MCLRQAYIVISACACSIQNASALGYVWYGYGFIYPDLHTSVHKSLFHFRGNLLTSPQLRLTSKLAKKAACFVTMLSPHNYQYLLFVRIQQARMWPLALPGLLPKQIRSKSVVKDSSPFHPGVDHENRIPPELLVIS